MVTQFPLLDYPITHYWVTRLFTVTRFPLLGYPVTSIPRISTIGLHDYLWLPGFTILDYPVTHYWVTRLFTVTWDYLGMPRQ